MTKSEPVALRAIAFFHMFLDAGSMQRVAYVAVVKLWKSSKSRRLRGGRESTVSGCTCSRGGTVRLKSQRAPCLTQFRHDGWLSSHCGQE